MVQKFGTSAPNEGRRMSMVALVSNPEAERRTAQALARALERRARADLGSVEQARQSVARKLGVGSGTFERIVRGRVKRVDAWMRDRLQALLVRELEAEIARLTHELELARQSGVHLASQQVGEIEAHLTAARTLIGGSR